MFALKLDCNNFFVSLSNKMKCVTMKVLPRVLLMGRKKTGLTGYIDKTN